MSNEFEDRVEILLSAQDNQKEINRQDRKNWELKFSKLAISTEITGPIFCWVRWQNYRLNKGNGLKILDLACDWERYFGSYNDEYILKRIERVYEKMYKKIVKKINKKFKEFKGLPVELPTYCRHCGLRQDD